ncbi:hypothetical protein QYM36_004667 [Artemia franciscana]|uniref:Uncharacterized protein n=1 Tax=Artemia franciscana TaxID=6661 RepID=A0AA88I370_ARTSF|nr:hypothetical protein QYM36_004667 [Artemia franciscana]
MTRSVVLKSCLNLDPDEIVLDLVKKFLLSENFFKHSETLSHILFYFSRNFLDPSPATNLLFDFGLLHKMAMQDSARYLKNLGSL